MTVACTAQAMDIAAIKLSCQAGLCEGVRHGVTTYFDLHNVSGATAGALEALADTTQEAGVRACLACHVAKDEDCALVMEETKALADRCSTSPEPSIGNGTAEEKEGEPEADHDETPPQRDDNGESQAKRAKLSHSPEKQRQDRRHGLAVRLALDISSLSDDVVGRLTDSCAPLGRGVHLDIDSSAALDRAAEFGLLQGTKPGKAVTTLSSTGKSDATSVPDTGTWVLDAASSVPNDVVAAPGTAHPCMPSVLQVLRQATMAMRDSDTGSLTPKGTEAVWRCIEASASVASGTFGVPLGVIREGAAADFVALTYQPCWPLDDNSAMEHLVGPLASASVDTVICNGRFLMQDGRIMSLAEADIASECRAAAARLRAAGGGDPE